MENNIFDGIEILVVEDDLMNYSLLGELLFYIRANHI